MSKLQLKPDPPLGLLGKTPAQGIFHRRFQAEQANTDLVEHYWWVSWNLPQGEVIKRSVLTHPSIHICMEQGQSWIYGVQQRTFSRQLHGCSQVLGIKFKPGGFYPFFGRSLHQLNDQRLPALPLLKRSELIRSELRKAELPKTGLTKTGLTKAKLPQTESNMPMSALIEEYTQRLQQCKNEQDIASILAGLDQGLATLCPKSDAETQQCLRLIDTIHAHSLSIKVSQLSQAMHMSERQLQRLCRQRIGMSPKALLNRYRMQEVARQLGSGNKSWKDFTDSLGYTDQAHFIRDFKKNIGQTPAAYIKSLQQAD